MPAEQPVSQPYWLAKHDGTSATAPGNPLVGFADDPALLRVGFQFQTPAGIFEVVRPVRNVHYEPGEGESSRPLVIAPPVTLRPSARVLVFPTAATKRVNLQITAHREGATGSVRLDLPGGWKSEPASCNFKVTAAGQSTEVTFAITPPSDEADVTVLAVAKIDGHEVSLDQTVVDYPHIERKTFFPNAALRLVRVPVEVRAKRIGYIMGTGDEVPPALEQLGCEVVRLSPESLAQSDLSKLDVIILGIRAYNVRPDVQLNRERLRAYAQQGGTLIMQYTVSPRGPNAPVDVPDLGPYPFRLSAKRVTVETSPMKFLLPAHSLLNTPNVITAKDFEGWGQERGLHFADQWDPGYEAPLGTQDPGEAMLPGGLLFARWGKGVFIYTSYVWFRQLPAGVPGAYRIFANLLSAGRDGP